mmetsp:Transcript_16920/g.33033  ORF Transcript_16920/g.33033 Transcript_16920/m.33033 type:complete len:80 (-) Transcript_16920:625-864(-)
MQLQEAGFLDHESVTGQLATAGGRARPLHEDFVTSIPKQSWSELLLILQVFPIMPGNDSNSRLFCFLDFPIPRLEVHLC